MKLLAGLGALITVLAIACSLGVPIEDHDVPAVTSDYLETLPKDVLYLVQMDSFNFTPSVIEARVGELIEIAIQNVEAVVHDFTIDRIDADLHISYLGGTGTHEHSSEADEADLHFALTVTGSGVVHIRVHEPGTYEFYCSVPGHREAGMVGVLVVTE